MNSFDSRVKPRRAWSIKCKYKNEWYTQTTRHQIQILQIGGAQFPSLCGHVQAYSVIVLPMENMRRINKEMRKRCECVVNGDRQKRSKSVDIVVAIVCFSVWCAMLELISRCFPFARQATMPTLQYSISPVAVQSVDGTRRNRVQLKRSQGIRERQRTGESSKIKNKYRITRIRWINKD